MKTQCVVGARVVLTSHHWLRPYESGIVVDQQKQALKKWLVQFADAYPGGGVGGNKLWCDEGDFAEVMPTRSSSVRRLEEAQEFSLGEAAFRHDKNGERHALGS